MKKKQFNSITINRSNEENFANNDIFVGEKVRNLIHVSVVPAWGDKISKRDRNLPSITSENMLVLNLNHVGAYGHIYTEVIPELLCVEETFPEYDCIVTSSSDLIEAVLQTFNLKLSNKIKFITNDQKFILNSNNLKIYNYSPGRYVNKQKNIKKLKNHIHEVFPTIKREKRLLLYCSRGNKETAKHGRKLSPETEDRVVELLKQHAFEHNLEFYFWNGIEPDGTTTSILKQYELFNNAKLVVGVHGGAFSNIIFLDPLKNPSVIEFCPLVGKSFINLSDSAFTTFSNYFQIIFDLPPQIKSAGTQKIIDYLGKNDATINTSELEKTLKQIDVSTTRFYEN